MAEIPFPDKSEAFEVKECVISVSKIFKYSNKFLKLLILYRNHVQS